MSYARFTPDSDVYVFLSIDGYLECCACSLLPLSRTLRASSTDEMLAHHDAHETAGHDVPEGTRGGLEADRAENEAHIAAMAETRA